MEQYEIIWAFILVIGFIILMALLAWELSAIQSEKEIRKMRKADERKATEERQLVEKIRTIAHEEAVKDSIAVQRLLGNMRMSEDDELTIAYLMRTMKGNDK